ncbi:hypothetical protein TSUD_102950 [Trifolium subterraneum]|uniref:Uncharacterized protein n=1 Tax=Trifolium subterraneum TaxID=3900 RepID=A0A2Z6MYK3_TRISU|nr:hypothetical protein TSUD_102950 [Trifolium subterraneum]
MAPKRANKKMVVRSTKKVVEESVQVSVVSSNKRSTRANKDVEIDKDVGTNNLKQENVKIIPVQEVTPSAEEDSNVSTTTFTTEDKTKQEKNTSNEETMEQPKESEKKVKIKKGNYAKTLLRHSLEQGVLVKQPKHKNRINYITGETEQQHCWNST